MRYLGRGDPLPFGPALLADVRDGTGNALPSDHCLAVTELALGAQATATRLG